MWFLKATLDGCEPVSSSIISCGSISPAAFVKSIQIRAANIFTLWISKNRTYMLQEIFVVKSTQMCFLTVLLSSITKRQLAALFEFNCYFMGE